MKPVSDTARKDPSQRASDDADGNNVVVLRHGPHAAAAAGLADTAPADAFANETTNVPPDAQDVDDRTRAPGIDPAQPGADSAYYEHPWRRFLKHVRISAFSSLTQRIVFLNIAALLVLAAGILYLDQSRRDIIATRTQSLKVQGEIIAGAIASAANVDTGTLMIEPERLFDLNAGEAGSAFENTLFQQDFSINPERVTPILRRLVTPTGNRARIFDQEGILIIDTDNLYSRGDVLRFDPVTSPPSGYWRSLWHRLVIWLWKGDEELYHEMAGTNGKVYAEIESALKGSTGSQARITQAGELIVSVAVPVQRARQVHGALMLTTEPGRIDAILRRQRATVLRVFVIAAVVTSILSILLAGTIAGPMHRLASAADRVRRGVNGVKFREQIPDFSARRDEIGHLSGSLRDMTNALYNRIEAIESFAADVAHELKNPLTSLRSAMETLPVVRSKADHARLIGIMQHDIRRLERLINDISDASRLDAELARADMQPVDVKVLLENVIAIANEIHGGPASAVRLAVRQVQAKAAAAKPAKPPEPSAEKRANAGPSPFVLSANDSRLGQVVHNLLDNACSFSRAGDVCVTLERLADAMEIRIEDRGPGVRPDSLEQIFARFYTDRPGSEAFGQNSGLGLSISRQIIEAHGGRIWAENRMDTSVSPARIIGARFVVRLPVT